MAAKKRVRGREIAALKRSLLDFARVVRCDYRRRYDEVPGQLGSAQLTAVLLHLGREIEEILDRNGYWTSESGLIKDTAEQMAAWRLSRIAKLIAKTQLAILLCDAVPRGEWKYLLLDDLTHFFPKGKRWGRRKWIRRLRDVLRMSKRAPETFPHPAVFRYSPEGARVKNEL